MSTTLHPSGFRISDRPVAASFAHPYSFQPVTDFLQRDESCLTSTMSLGGVEGTWVRYWDETSTVAVLEFKIEEPTHQAAASKEKEKEKEKKKKFKGGDMMALTMTIRANSIATEPDAQLKSLPIAPSELPLSDKPVTLSLSKNAIKLGTGKRHLEAIVIILTVYVSQQLSSLLDSPWTIRTKKKNQQWTPPGVRDFLLTRC